MYNLAVVFCNVPTRLWLNLKNGSAHKAEDPLSWTHYCTTWHTQLALIARTLHSSSSPRLITLRHIGLTTPLAPIDGTSSDVACGGSVACGGRVACGGCREMSNGLAHNTKTHNMFSSAVRTAYYSFWYARHPRGDTACILQRSFVIQL